MKRTVKHHSRDDTTWTAQACFCHLGQLLVRKSETKRLNAANSILDSFQASGLEEPQRATSTSSKQHQVYTQQGGFEQRMKGTPWAMQSEDSQAELRMPEERHRPMIGWNKNTRILRDFWDEMDMTAGCAAYACQKRQETQSCMTEATRGVEDHDNPTIRMHDTRHSHRNTTGHSGSRIQLHSSCTNDRHQRH